MLNQFKNLSCYEEFEIQCALACISNIDVLKRIGYQIDNYYFFISNDGIFNWFDLKGNHVKDPCILDELNDEYIPRIINSIINNSIFNNITLAIINPIIHGTNGIPKKIIAGLNCFCSR